MQARSNLRISPLPQDDLTAELYLFTVLRDYLLYDVMNMFVDEM